MQDDGNEETRIHVYLAMTIPALERTENIKDLYDNVDNSEFKLWRFYFEPKELCIFGITYKIHGFNTLSKRLINRIFCMHVTKQYDTQEIELVCKNYEIEGNPKMITGLKFNLSDIKTDPHFTHTSIRHFTLRPHVHEHISLDGILSSMTDTPQASQALTLIDCHDDACLHAVKSMIRSLPRDIDYRLVDASMLTDACLLIEANDACLINKD